VDTNWTKLEPSPDNVDVWPVPHKQIIKEEQMNIKKICVWVFFSALIAWGSLPEDGFAKSTRVVGDFSSASPDTLLPQGWDPMTFKKIKNRTSYSLVKEDGIRVIKAHSRGASSGLMRRVSIDPAQYPVISWRWKTRNMIKNADVTLKSGDDYPARLYITFAYDGSRLGFFERTKFNAAKLIYGEYPPLAAINYIWDGKAPQGTSIPNAYTSRVMMVVVESGEDNLDTWIEERRNIRDDYRKLFGQDPPLISGVAIMTDTDNTGGEATTFYGDIIFSEK